MGYTKQAVAGFSWQTIQKLVSAGVTMVKIFVLARLLGPTDFGLFSLTAIAIGITESLTETGINLTILQSKQSVAYFLNTAWVIAIYRGFAIALVMLGMGWGLSQYFDNPQLWPLIALASLIPIIKGLINPTIVSWHKNMEFQTESFYRFFLVAVEALASILLAAWLHSAWALVLGMLIAAGCEVILSFLLLKDRPRWSYSPACASQIFHNAKWLSVATAFHYLNENFDNLILGKLGGTYNLGIYQNAYALSHKVNYEVSKSIHHGTIPIFTRIVDSLPRLKAAVLKSLSVSTLIVVAGSLPLLIAPELVVKYLLGSKWLETIPLLRVLTFAGLVQSFSSLGYTLFLAKKTYWMMNLHLILTFLLTVSLIWLGFRNGGLPLAVTGVLGARLITAPIIVWGLITALKTPIAFSRKKI